MLGWTTRGDSTGRGGATAAVARQSRPLPALRSTKNNKVFTYDIGVTRGTRLALLGMTAGDGGV
jgi:hypothetical protein